MEINTPTGQNNSLLSQAKALFGKTISNQKAELDKNVTKVPPVVQESSKASAAKTDKLEKLDTNIGPFISKDISEKVLKEVARSNLKSLLGPDTFSAEALEAIASAQAVAKDFEIPDVNKDVKTSDSGSSSPDDVFKKLESRDTVSEALGNLVDKNI